MLHEPEVIPTPAPKPPSRQGENGYTIVGLLYLWGIMDIGE